MAYVLSSVSGNLISAASAGFAPTNSADVSAIASAYQVVSATATQLNAGTAYLTSVNETPISAARAGNAANASLATSAYYDGTGRLISALPDSAAVSSIASSYAESAASGKLDKSALDRWQTGDEPIWAYSGINGIPIHPTAADYANEADYAESAGSATYAESADYWLDASSKQDALTFGYDTSDKISSINGSSLAGEGGGLVTSIQTAQDPWYQQSISGLNGSSIYPKWAVSANSAGTADTAGFATFAQSAGAAPTSWASSFISSVSSPSGTIRVMNGNEIEGTNSAVLPSTVVEGFSVVSSLNYSLTAFSFTVPTSNPNTQVIITGGWANGNFGISGDNGVTAESSVAGPLDVTFDMPGATAFDVTSEAWVSDIGYTASALASEVGGGIGELAWASALPTYQYDAEDKISSINGSALAGGGAAGVDSATCSAIASAYAESAVSAASSNYYTTANESGFLTAQVQASWSESASASPSYIQDKPDLVDIVAGPGIVIDNPDGNTLRVSCASAYETLLWSGFSPTTTTETTYNLSENIRNFLKFKVVASPNDQTTGGFQRPMQEFVFNLENNSENGAIYAQFPTYSIGSNTLMVNYWYLRGSTGVCTSLGLLPGVRQVNGTVSTGVTAYSGSICQIWGIHRTASN